MKTRTLAAGIVSGIILATPQAALAQSASTESPAPAASPAADEFALVSVFGTGITLSIGVDATGHLTSVELTDGAGGVPADAVATEVSPHEVKFVIGDGATKIEVETEGRKVETEVEARSLADLSGTHTWSGELFGAGNGRTEITFSVSDNGGMPVVELTSISGPGAGTEVVKTEVEQDDDHEYEAKLKIDLFDADGNEARITVEVEVEDEDDGVEAELKISARSDFFATADADGPVEDPIVNTPVDDDDDDHDDDDHDDDDHDDDDDDDHDDDDDDDHDDEDDDDDEDEHDDDD